MIYKLIFIGNREDIAQAKSQLDLLQNYDSEFDELHEIKEVIELTESDIKGEKIRNTEYNEEFPNGESPELLLSNLIDGDDFKILASTEYY